MEKPHHCIRHMMNVHLWSHFYISLASVQLILGKVHCISQPLPPGQYILVFRVLYLVFVLLLSVTGTHDHGDPGPTKHRKAGPIQVGGLWTSSLSSVCHQPVSSYVKSMYWLLLWIVPSICWAFGPNQCLKWKSRSAGTPWPRVSVYCWEVPVLCH